MQLPVSVSVSVSIQGLVHVLYGMFSNFYCFFSWCTKTTSKLSDKKCLAIVSINHMHPLRPLYTSLGSRGPNQIAEHHYRCGLSSLH